MGSRLGEYSGQITVQTWLCWSQFARCARCVDRCVIVHEQLRRSPVRLELFFKRLNATSGRVPTAGSIRITVHDDQRTLLGLFTFIKPNSTPNHQGWLTTS
jgi:hypothetical protein